MLELSIIVLILQTCRVALADVAGLCSEWGVSLGFCGWFLAPVSLFLEDCHESPEDTSSLTLLFRQPLAAAAPEFSPARVLPLSWSCCFPKTIPCGAVGAPMSVPVPRGLDFRWDAGSRHSRAPALLPFPDPCSSKQAGGCRCDAGGTGKVAWAGKRRKQAGHGRR